VEDQPLVRHPITVTFITHVVR